MFLFERAFGVGTYMVLLLFACILLANTNLTCKTTLKIYLLCLCVMALFYKPYITADLYRAYSMSEFFGNMDFVYFWRNYAIGTDAPMARLLYWVVGRIGIPSILPIFSAFVCYTFVFYIISKSQERFKISKKNVAYVLFFVMTTSIYISVIGGIRMMLALSAITFCYFRITVEKQIGLIEIVLCAVSIFVHSMGLVLLAICLVVIAFDNKKSVLRRVIFALLIVSAVLFFVFNFEWMITNLVEKVGDYVLGDRYSDFWEYIMGALIITLLVLLIIRYWRIRNDQDCSVLRSLNLSTVICLAISLVFCFEFSIFYRFGGQLAVLLSIPMLLVTLEKANFSNQYSKHSMDFRSLLIAFSTIIAIISCTRGSLSSLKFFEL